MTRVLHNVAIIPGTALAMEDRLFKGHWPDFVTLAGRGAVSAVGVGTPGVGYATIPTVAINIPASGAGNTGSGAAVTALMGVVAVPTIAAAGSGGSNGAVTLTGTTGTGTKFQLTGTIAGGVLSAISAISVAGSYSALPSTLAAEPVTGGSLTGCTVNLAAAMGVIGYNVGSGGSLYPASGVTASLSGGTPVTAAVPGAVTVASAAGQGAAMDFVTALPGKYTVELTPNQDVTAWVTNKTNTGFTVNVAPRLAATTLGAGTVDIGITG